MEQLLDRSASADMQAGQLINQTLEEQEQKGNSSPEAMQSAIKAKTDGVSAEVRSKMYVYMSGVKPALEGAAVKELDDGIGGLYSGSQQIIATSTLEVRGNMQDTIARTIEVGAHEKYHADHKHLEAMESVEGAGDTVLVMGGKEYTEEALIEGLTVSQTGDKFCSDGYRQFKVDLQSGMKAAGLDITDVEEAVNEQKDLKRIDDRTKALTE